MRTHKSRRAVRSSKQLDESAMRAWLAKMQPSTTALGVVRQFPGEASHFDIDIDPDTGKQTIYVDVEIVPSSERVFCKLGWGQDQVYKIPRVNQEVAVLIPSSSNSLIKDGLDFDPIIVGILDQDVPAELDGDDVIVITAPRVIMTGQSLIQLAGTDSLAKHSELVALRDYIQTQLTLPVSAGVAGPVASPTAPTSTGTSVVKGS